MEKEALVKQLLETSDESIIVAIKKIFKKEKKDRWEELSQEQKDNIEDGQRQIERGEVINYNEFIKQYL